MKRRICVRSMGLGAVIMLIGLAVGAIVSPPLVAQHDGVFDEIQCRRLEVVDENGNSSILLVSNKAGVAVAVLNKQGEIAIGLTSTESVNAVDVSDKQGEVAIRLASIEELNAVDVFDKQGEVAIDLTVSSVSEIKTIGIRDAGNEAIRMGAFDSSNSIGIYDRTGELKWRRP